MVLFCHVGRTTCLTLMTSSLERPLNICLLSYRSNPHCGGQGVYLKNLSRALKDIGHHVEVFSGPPDPGLDPDIPTHRPACLDLYNPESLFRVPTLRELCDPVNIMEWAGVSTMGFPEPFTFGIRALVYLAAGAARYPWQRFLAVDGVSVAAQVLLFVGIGYYAGERIQWALSTGKKSRFCYAYLPSPGLW